jgi:hypothetical protein
MTPKGEPDGTSTREHRSRVFEPSPTLIPHAHTVRTPGLMPVSRARKPFVPPALVFWSAVSEAAPTPST